MYYAILKSGLAGWLTASYIFGSGLHSFSCDDTPFFLSAVDV
jgi:hypothetical protein